MGSSLMDGSPRRDRFIGYGGLRADVVWEGLSGRFDALSDLLSDPVKRSSKFHLVVKPSRCPGSAPPVSSAGSYLAILPLVCHQQGHEQGLGPGYMVT